jgi:hypothetical protein
MTPEEIRGRTQGVWDNFYSLSEIWRRSDCVRSLKARFAFVFISKLYRQNVRQYGYRHRQRAQEERQSLGTLAGQALPALVSSQTDARASRSSIHQRVILGHSNGPLIVAAWAIPDGLRIRFGWHLGAPELIRAAVVLSDFVVGRINGDFRPSEDQ